MDSENKPGSPYGNVRPLIESVEREYHDAGITSTVSIRGHPVHPMIVFFPVAFLIGAALTDIAYAFSGEFFWARGSYWLLIAGLVTSVLAAATGLRDFLKIERVRAHAAGWYHLSLNATALVLTLVNLLLRNEGQAAQAIVPWGLVLSVFVVVGLVVSGWFGAELVYRHKVGVIGDTDRHAS